MSTHGLLFQRASTIKIQLSILVQYKVDIIIISLNVTCSHHYIASDNVCMPNGDQFYLIVSQFHSNYDHISGVMISMLTTSVVCRGFESRSGQTKDNTIGICYFSAKHAALRRKSKDWLARNQDNVSVEQYVNPRTVVSKRTSSSSSH